MNPWQWLALSDSEAQRTREGASQLQACCAPGLCAGV